MALYPIPTTFSLVSIMQAPIYKVIRCVRCVSFTVFMNSNKYFGSTIQKPALNHYKCSLFLVFFEMNCIFTTNYYWKELSHENSPFIELSLLTGVLGSLLRRAAKAAIAM